MTEPIWLAIIAALPPTLAVLIAIAKVHRLHHQINSRQDEWVKTAVAAGVSAALAIERERANAAAIRRGQEID